MEGYPDEPLWLTTFAEYLYDDVKVQYWNDDAIDDPIYALQLHEETWSIIDMKTILK